VRKNKCLGVQGLQRPFNIGTDYITKTLPHHHKPNKSVTPQICVLYVAIIIFESSTAIAHLIIGYYRTRTVFIVRMPSSYLRRQSAQDARHALNRCGRGIAYADLSVRKSKNTVLSLSDTRPTSYLAQVALLSQKMLRWTSSTNWSHCWDPI
jgi:hypothetical protein